MRAVFISTCVFFAACGGGTEGVPDSAMDPDTGVMMDDAGDMPDTKMPAPYPAPHPDMPRVVSSGGPVLKNGFSVVPVFYSGDTQMQMSIEQFLKATTGSPYWKAIVTEYGSGDFVVQPTVVLQGAAPALLTDTQIRQFIASQADGTHAPWPKADGNTLFAMFYPSGTTITLQNSTSCQGFGAYHNGGNLVDATPFAYAVMPRCQGGIDILTASTSHELVEAASDPYPQGNQGAYGQIDNDHLVWEFASSGGEIGDMCEADQDSYQRMVGNFLVQRSWSNASAKAGHDPCVPALTKPAYFNAVPVQPDTIMLNFGQTIVTKGVKIPIGQMKTIDVDLFSDKACPPWTVIAQQTQGTGNLTFAWDATQGANGDVLHLTITAVKNSQFGASAFEIASTDGNYTHKYYGLVQFQ